MRSVKSVAILASLCSAAVASAAPIFAEDFESGSANWSANDGNPVGLTTDDTTACSTSFQHEAAATAGRLISTNVATPVLPGDYCLSAWVRATNDAAPFVGLSTADANSNLHGWRWLIGTAGYDDGYGDQIAGVNGDGVWHWYAASVTLDSATASVWVVDEMTGTGGYADFDDIQLTAGPCATVYAGADQHQTCAGDTPVCGVDGSCQPVVTPPADMGGGPSATPDMGSAPGPSLPGANQSFTPAPSTPVAAEGMPSGTGAVTASAGGCSVLGAAVELPLGTVLLAMVGVVLFARRRRA